jgi:predicted nuclease of predicted toxin-antitoxin system
MRWLLDEMLPAATCRELDRRGHDAVSVYDAGLGGATDDDVFDFAVREERILVTENFADYALLVERRLTRSEPCVPVVFVRKSDLARRGGLATRLAKRLHDWAAASPDPYVGLHWP